MIHVLIVGQGGMGKVHAINYQALENVHIVGFVGSNPDISEQFKVKHFDSITQACESEVIDVVDVCTPTFVHKDHVLEAFSHHKHVICEKPLALKGDDAQLMFDKAKEVNKHLYVAHVVQFMQETQFLRETVKNQSYGKLLDGYFERLASIPKWVSPWMFERDKAGLIPYDLHVHDLDLIVSLFGKPTDYTVQVNQGISQFPEHFRFIYNFDGATAASEAAWFNAEFPFTARWRVVFEKAVLVYDGEKVIVYPETGKPIIHKFESELILESGINVGETDMYFRELRHFINCIEKDIPSPYLNEGQILEVISILEEIDQLY